MYSIIVVSYGDPSDVIRLAEELHDLLIERIVEIIVVDNFVSKNYTDILECSLPKEVILYKSQHNLGFAGACNKGVKLSTGKSVILVNPDAFITKASLLEFIESDRELRQSKMVGVTGINITSKSEKQTVIGSKFPALHDLFYGLVGYNRLFIYTLNESGTQRIDQVIGAFFCTTRNIWDRLTGFDEQFFVYYEELDFCYRLYQNGYHNYVFTGIYMEHASGEASKNAGVKRTLFQLRSKRLFYNKHFATAKVFVSVIVFMELIIRLIITKKLDILTSSIKYVYGRNNY